MNKINTLVFEGGGVYGYAYIGALKELKKKLDLKKVRQFCGSSIGSLIAFGLSLGIDPDQFVDIVNKFRIQCLFRVPSIAMKIPWNAVFKYGLINSDIVRDIALIALKAAHPTKTDIKFRELERDLIITATNLTDSYLIVASKQTTPEMSVIDAVMYSCCGNIALCPTTIKLRKQNKTAIIIDGGASVFNFPIAIYTSNTSPGCITNMLDNEFSRDLYAQYGGKWSDLERVIRSTNDKKVLGIKFDSQSDYVNIPINTIFSYLWNFMNVTYQSLLQATNKETRYTITIDMQRILPFDITYIFLPYKTQQMMNIGREAVLKSKLFC